MKRSFDRKRYTKLRVLLFHIFTGFIYQIFVIHNISHDFNTQFKLELSQCWIFSWLSRLFIQFRESDICRKLSHEIFHFGTLWLLRFDTELLLPHIHTSSFSLTFSALKCWSFACKPVWLSFLTILSRLLGRFLSRLENQTCSFIPTYILSVKRTIVMPIFNLRMFTIQINLITSINSIDRSSFYKCLYIFIFHPIHQTKVIQLCMHWKEKKNNIVAKTNKKLHRSIGKSFSRCKLHEYCR